MRHNVSLTSTPLMEWMRKEGIKNESLAEILNVTPVWISYLRRGRVTPSVKLALRISRLTGLTLGEILDPMGQQQEPAA
jgi:transcriptional regulator with XRE-family HTH domain